MSRQLPPDIAAAIVKARTVRGMTQHQVASLLGVDVSTVSRWETSQRIPSGPGALALIALLALDGAVAARLVALAGPRPHTTAKGA